MTYTGMQMAGWTVMCLAAGIGIGATGLRILEAIAEQREDKAAEEQAKNHGLCGFGRYA